MYRALYERQLFNVKSEVVIFKADITTFDQKKYCTLSFCYTVLCARFRMKEVINSFFKLSALKTIMKTQYACIFSSLILN